MKTCNTRKTPSLSICVGLCSLE